ncbi:MAG TPA: VOC family protein [Tepidisphaeraceae bacterium]|nr:VOC family protein [Tepidisphaeraceae bacterium]
MIAVEHVAWQVNDPQAVAKWYIENLGFRVLRKMENSPFTHFIADAGGKVVLEIYNNPAVNVPAYPSMNPLHLHLAFATADPEAERDRLLSAGATVAENMIITPAGDKLIMLRDPWGFAIQLCKRSKPMM